MTQTDDNSASGCCRRMRCKQS